jgi:hypothetical protein
MRFLSEALMVALVAASMSGLAWASKWKNYMRPPIASDSNF